MKIIDFYRGGIGNQNGNTLSEILTWSKGWLEGDHDYVQWLLPSNETSQINGEAPTLTLEESQIFKEDKELQDKVKQSLVKFLWFLDFKLVRDDEQVIIEPVVEIPDWLKGFNHNMLRVTRLIKSLRLTGLEKYANAYYTALLPFKNKVSINTWSYWQKAAIEPLW